MKTRIAAGLAALALAACAARAPEPPISVAPSVEYKLNVLDLQTGEVSELMTRTAEIGAPNFSPDGQSIIVNAEGRLFAVPIHGGEPLLIPTGEINIITGDHAPSPDGESIAFSSYDVPDMNIRVASIFTAPIAGGGPRQITTAGPSYFHAWSPEGARIAFTGRRDDPNNYDVWEVEIATGQERRLTDAPGTDDGADYAPDGTIYFNSQRTGAMRIWRMEPDGQDQTQITFDDSYQDWFPHPSPDGKWLVWLSYPADVTGLAVYQPVAIRIMPRDGSTPPLVLAQFIGGQGSINAPPWSPDSSRIAFVSHRLIQ